MDVFSKIAGAITSPQEKWRQHPAYWLFEPWDVEERPPEVLAQAIADGVDLSADYLVRAVGTDPHLFQAGYLLSTAFRRILMAMNQGGKMVLDDEMIPTPSGFVRADELEVGNIVFGSDGDPCRINEIPFIGDSRSYRVSFTDGPSIIVSEDHLWKCKTHPQRFVRTYKSRGRSWPNPEFDEWKVKSTAELISECKYSPTTKSAYRASVPVASPVRYPGNRDLVDPYLIGLMIGDGSCSCSHVSLTTADDEISDYMISKHGANRGAGKYKINMSGMSKIIHGAIGYGRSWEKTIPEEYLLSSVVQRKELLAGLLDTDGFCDKRGHVSYTTTSDKLRDTFIELAESLGCIVNSVYSRHTSYPYKGKLLKGRLSHTIRIRTRFNPFKLTRKRDRWRPVDSHRHERIIESIVPVGVMTGRCFSVSSYDQTFLASRRYIVTHNSLVVLMEILIRASGEIPLSLQYPKGHDTGVPREIHEKNVIRWGRRRPGSDIIIDHNPLARNDGTWDCGNVTGVGIFPVSKIVEPNTTIRLASRQGLIKQNWWPAFTGSGNLSEFVPEQFIDRTRGAYGNRGSNKQDNQVFLCRGVTLQILTYDAGKEGFEGVKWPTYLDEEPPRDDVTGAVVTHCTDWSLSETPYEGITFSKDLAFPNTVTPDSETFHAAAYDCPYLTDEDIRHTREELKSKEWEIGARLWGIPTEQAGKPYYDRTKINLWIQRFQQPFKYVTFEPVNEWHGIITDETVSHLPGLMDTPVRMVELQKDDKKATWKLYEDRKDGEAYCGASDQADGAEDAEDAGDLSTVSIGRASYIDPTKPHIAATLRSTLPTPQFAREVMFAGRYFNNMLIAPESGRGDANGAFRVVAADWPYWFKDVTTRQSSRKQQTQMGFLPTTNRRGAVFDSLIRDWLDSYEIDEYPNIPDEWILREAAGAVVSKTPKGEKKCDHPNSGTIDSLMAWGILLFVFQKEYNMQIRCNAAPEENAGHISWLQRAMMEEQKKKAPFGLGSRITQLR